jgi:hypothetical protein
MSREPKIWFVPRARGIWPVSREGWFLSITGLCAMFFASVVAVQLGLAGNIAAVIWIVLGAFVVATVFLLLALRHTSWSRPLMKRD